MKIGFYPKLALDGIRKNKRMYLPYSLTCIGMVMMHYIILFLQTTETLSGISGAGMVNSLMTIGGWVIAVFSCIFLFYTNSFLIRRRKKEFGLYNMLGMSKRNIGMIIFWETVIIYVGSMAIGLLFGIAFSKLAELLLVNLIMTEVNFDLTVPLESVLMTLAVFGVIFFLILLNSIRQIRFSSAISLLKSESLGEKPPKGNKILGILGFLILVGAYYIAVTIKDPISALAWFFIAVLMVIVATYLLMISGSVTFCRALQGRKNYYYKPNHFVSVSSMVYRMKRNGAGLASICILATMVLVMISTTSGLYFGAEDALKAGYPGEINYNARYNYFTPENLDDVDAMREEINNTITSYGAEIKKVADYRQFVVEGRIDGNEISRRFYVNDMNLYSDRYYFYLIPLEDYNAMMNTDESLSESEVLLYTGPLDYSGDVIGFEDGKSFNIKKRLTDMFNITDLYGAQSAVVMVVRDIENAVAGFETAENRIGFRAWIYQFDTGLDAEKQLELYDILKGDRTAEGGGHTYAYCSVASRELNRAEFYGLYGGLFFLGILLSLVFIIAAVLIIYYKQLSEGYEDKSRFEIMQKVGMTKRDIRKSINSQLLTVFFLPLLGAGVHLAFAFPIILKLLLLFDLDNTLLFIATTLITFAIFALFYTLVYRKTSNVYFKIVSDAKSEG